MKNQHKSWSNIQEFFELTRYSAIFTMNFYYAIIVCMDWRIDMYHSRFKGTHYEMGLNCCPQERA